MPRFALTSVLATVATLVSCLGSTTSAQNTNTPAPPQQENTRDAARQPSPYAWPYVQQPHLEDPRKAAIRRRAEFRAQQRELRLAAQQWYGVSNSRPTVSATPWWSSYRPVPVYRTWRRYAWFSQPAVQPTRSTTVETTIETTADGAAADNKLVR